MKPIDCCAGVGRNEYFDAGMESNAATRRAPYWTAKNLNDMTTSFCAIAALLRLATDELTITAMTNRQRLTRSPMTERTCNTTGVGTIHPEVCEGSDTSATLARHFP